jgi:shikimate dehydrogenase
LNTARVVASLAAGSFAELVEAARGVARACDLVEVRLDALGGDDGRVEAIARGCAAVADAAGRPIVIACHGPEAHGAFSAGAEERLALLRAGADAAQYVDVQVELLDRLGPLPAGVARVVSDHGGDATTDHGARLRALLARVGPSDRAKYVPTLDSGEQGLELLAASARAADPRLVCFGAGRRVAFTRQLAPLFGSSWVYAAADEGAATAPGQLSVQTLRARWPRSGPDQTTRAFAVVGRGILHSASPRVHAAAQRRAALDAIFVALDVDDFERAFALVDGQPVFHGLAVTAPFKERAAQVASSRDALVRRIGAANTLVRARGAWAAHNTDAQAVEDLVERVAPGARRALVLGAGGAARAALGALLARGVEVGVAARRASASRALAEELDVVNVDWSRLEAFRPDLVVQATPLGGADLPGESPPLAGPWPASRALIEVNYGAGSTPLVSAARSAGARAADGRDWFLAQAFAQFERFHGLSPDAAAMAAAFDQGSAP